MRRSIIPNTFSALALSVLMSFGAMPQPAHAQYFNNLPYYIGTSVFWPLGRLLLGSSNTYNYMNPYYLGNTLVNRTVTSTGILRAPGYGPNPAPVGLAGYTDEEPLNSPRQRNRPFRYGQYGVDQTAYASGYTQPNPDAVVPQAVGQPGAPGMPAIIPGQNPGQILGTPAFPNQQIGQSAGMPPFAPSRKKQKRSRSQQSQPQQTQQQAQQQAAATPLNMVPHSAAPAPLAQGFVDLVNSKYDGDISKALFNADSRAWAHTVGLVENNDIFGADLSQERVNVISRIFKDPGLDACSKLEASKILLRTSSPATPVAGASR